LNICFLYLFGISNILNKKELVDYLHEVFTCKDKGSKRCKDSREQGVHGEITNKEAITDWDKCENKTECNK